MEKIFHRKLIRDNVPGKIREAGATFETRILDEKEFKEELLKKLGEETAELQNAPSKEGMVAELADVLAVIDEIKRAFTISDAELSEARRLNVGTKGGFKGRFFLEWSEDADNKSSKNNPE